MSERLTNIAVLCLAIGALVGTYSYYKKEQRIQKLEEAVNLILETDVGSLRDMGAMQEAVSILHERQRILARVVTGMEPPSLQEKDITDAEVETF